MAAPPTFLIHYSRCTAIVPARAVEAKKDHSCCNCRESCSASYFSNAALAGQEFAADICGRTKNHMQGQEVALGLRRWAF
eukprot:1153277-Pelagomonas_calceolata.AAC.16